MKFTSVTSRGQVTIPKAVRQQLGIHQGSHIEFAVVGNCVELRVHSASVAQPSGGFGILKSSRRSVPADFDPASLQKK